MGGKRAGPSSSCHFKGYSNVWVKHRKKEKFKVCIFCWSYTFNLLLFRALKCEVELYVQSKIAEIYQIFFKVIRIMRSGLRLFLWVRSRRLSHLLLQLGPDFCNGKLVFPKIVDLIWNIVNVCSLGHNLRINNITCFFTIGANFCKYPHGRWPWLEGQGKARVKYALLVLL